MNELKNIVEESCEQCGNQTRLGLVKKYHFTESGLDNIYLLSVPALHCDACGFESVMIPSPKRIQKDIANALANQASKLSGQEVRFLRKYLELSINEIAEVFSVRRETVSRWENGAETIGDIPERLLRCLALQSRSSRPSLMQLLRSIQSNQDAPEIDIDIATHEYAYA